MPYKRTIPGLPYTKTPPLTKGFTPGVSYFKNLLAVRPIWAACIGMVCLSSVLIGYQCYAEFIQHPDMQEMYHMSYKVRRIEDVDDPTRECYNN